MVKNDTTMRRKDFSGENEWRGAWVVKSARIESRDEGVKSWEERRLVMRRVFEGGDGWIRGGMLDRSRERDVREGFWCGVDEGESGGEAAIICCVGVVVGGVVKRQEVGMMRWTGEGRRRSSGL